ncbi:universal stress protein [Halorubellus sp. PRR65]|uniref:universal stress protein n=1 Tax=Halorubellus sp. PRR65 TaxID=3098148 RepID=UPI002B25A0CF|nr:universal stress protein [Halorubellus sp. PRR65]
MYHDVLVPVTAETSDTRFLYHVGELATAIDAEVTLLAVADTNRDSVTLVDGDVVDALETEGEQALSDAEGVLESLGLDAHTDVVQGSPAQTIVDYVDRYEHDLVAMPTHARTGLQRYLLGSVTEKVVRLSPVPVLTARTDEDDLAFPYDRLLVAVDGSAASRRASEHALSLAAALDAGVDVLSVVDTGGIGPDVRAQLVTERARESAQDLVRDVETDATDRGISDVRTEIVEGLPADAIASYVDDHAVDAVVMGTTGRTGMDRVLLGSVAEKTVRTAPVPVLTVRHDGD